MKVIPMLWTGFSINKIMLQLLLGQFGKKETIVSHRDFDAFLKEEKDLGTMS